MGNYSPSILVNYNMLKIKVENSFQKEKMIVGKIKDVGNILKHCKALK